ncbi:DUF4221 family protein [Cyclobacterium amurskyense]|uniref:DUF4221 domain-containing protein n=1 Tax=Cyclobacterium amurskyense TaxID=320787 RepID=A0A0H4PAM0_9BACT|nr:DUF4221 family protein [Cyclobacterium amurskyense]AKP51254.1 hypothetical protein CA2015_1821 [Cyclobacterium amurskyense]
MKKSFIIVLCGLLVYCGEKNEGKVNVPLEIHFTLDTLLIDPVDEFLYLNAGLQVAALDEKKQYLYNFNPNDYTLEKIDLNKGILADKLPFEKEGPNGVGGMVFGLNLISSNSIAFMGYMNVGLFDLEGSKRSEFTFNDKAFAGDKMAESESFQFLSNQMVDLHTMIGLIRDNSEKTYALGILNTETQSLTKVPLPFEALENFRFRLSSPSRIQMSSPTVTISKHQESYIISNEISNSILIYDNDSLLQIDYQSKLTADKKTGKYNHDFENEEAFKQTSLDMRREINFMAPLWDEEKQLFYRFSHKIIKIGKDVENYQDTESAVYLTVFDPDFNVIAASLVEALNTPPGYHFVKDGKIWMYINRQDEMGFVQLTVDIE